MNTRDACVQAISDAQFVAPLVQTGDLFTLRHAGRSNSHGSNHDDKDQPKTYFYVFDYQMKEGDYPQVSLKPLQALLFSILHILVIGIF